jgi:aryl-alcohol dehydrogenase-like predicted oxidoreductase
MRHLTLGSTGVSASEVGQGTWQVEQEERGRVVAALRSGVEAGLTLVDTADLYGRGVVEEVVGEALRGLRDRVTLCTKVQPARASREGVVTACEKSLTRLGTDHLDLYVLHWVVARVPLAETLEGFARLQEQGKVRAYGLCNLTAPELLEAFRMAGPGRIACLQATYHLRERQAEQALLAACREAGVTFMAASPLGSGNFPSPETPGGRVLQEIAQAHGATMHRVALRFLLRHGHVVVLPKATSEPHILDNAAAGELTLSDDDVARIDDVFRR